MVSEKMVRKGGIQWYQANDGTVANLESTEIEEAIVDNVCPTSGLFEDLGVALGDGCEARARVLLDSSRLCSGAGAFGTAGRIAVKVGILAKVRKRGDCEEQRIKSLTSLPKAFLAVSLRTRLAMYLAAADDIA